MKPAVLLLTATLTGCGARSGLEPRTPWDAGASDVQDSSRQRSARDYEGTYLGLRTTEVLWTDPATGGASGDAVNVDFRIVALDDRRFELWSTNPYTSARYPDGGSQQYCRWPARVVGDRAEFEVGAMCSAVPPPGVVAIASESTMAVPGDIRLTGNLLSFRHELADIWLISPPLRVGLGVRFDGRRR